MDIKRLLFLLTAFSSLLSCTSNDRKFTVMGQVEGMPAQNVVLEQLSANDIISIVDSARSKDDGSFKLSAVAPEPGLYRIHFTDNKYILLSVDKGNVKITADWNAIEGYKVSGSAGSAQLSWFLQMFREKVNEFNTMNVVLDTLRARGNDSLLALAQKNYQEMNQDFTLKIENYADTTPYEPNAIFAARILSPASEGNFLYTFSQSLNKRFPGTKMTRDFNEHIAKVNKQYLQAEQPKPQPVDIGTIAPEIKLPTPDGTEVALSSLRGKYVLLDFWASWCGPCRAENPNIVAVYNKYKGKNFTIYAVSLDEKKENWQQAIQDDKLVWTQVSDLKGWLSSAATTYSIKAIPANVLIGPDGKILAHDLRGPALEEALEKAMASTTAPVQ